MPSSITDTEFPVEYLTVLDEVLAQGSFAARYNVQGAEFVNARQVSVPDISFDSMTVNDYDGFVAKNKASINRTLYNLSNDKQAVFDSDALDQLDDAANNILTVASEYERVVLAPTIDKDFFSVVNTKAGGKGTTVLSKDNIKSEIRKARTQFNQAGLAGGDMYMTSAALALLEDTVDRQFSNDTSITDTVGSYDGFQIFETPTELLTTDFTVISGGQRTVRYITKRAVNYLFRPGQHTQGDCWLDQMRWVYGTVIHKNKIKGIYTNKGAAA